VLTALPAPQIASQWHKFREAMGEKGEQEESKRMGKEGTGGDGKTKERRLGREN